ncbi:carboxymuconolactone decarboxylase family protein [Novosphingobium sp. SG720]|uniref:carboxymuconolactone decarboxylase family protein n=1 Tax=Novosphingobium sp. SG720 TaxID=2586998 RepID=UPI001446AB2E|nr:carboxymuconolactone decarboxylase family protein [Novosphingobium sp. SG720]NKJ44794.1 alkylhydroperoxidase family enzyme [Novosphingobium sp. SG720]
MGRLRYLDNADLGPDHQEIPRMKSNITRAVAHSPDLARLVAGRGMYFRHKSKLEPRLRELAILQVGWSTRSAYEWAHHVDVALSFGVSEADIHAIGQVARGEATHLDPLALAVLEAARSLTEDIALAQGVFDALAAALSADQLVDLLVAIGEYNGLVRVMAAIEIDLEPEYEAFLARFPLPDAA